jgi:AraC-like DNA-binding protein
LQDKRLQKAKELLQAGELKASDIYLDIGYNKLSNFSIAFINKFGIGQKKARLICFTRFNLLIYRSIGL